MTVVVQLITLIGLYYAAGVGAWQIAIPPNYASVFWPSAGVALAFVYLYGYRLLPGVFVGALLLAISSPAHTVLNSTVLVIACCVSFGSMLQAFAGAFLLRKFVGSMTQFQELRSIVLFSVIGIGSSVVAASVAAASFYFKGILPFGELFTFWEPWFIGDMLGVLIIFPLLVLLLSPKAVSRRRMLSVTVPVSLLLFCVILLFLHLKEKDFQSQQDEFQQNIMLLHHDLTDEFNAHLGQMSAIRSFYDSSMYVDHNEFTSFVKNALEQDNWEHAFGWAPYVQHKELEALYGLAKQIHGDDFHVYQRSADGDVEPVPDADVYMPLLFVSPLERSGRAVGFDLWSDDARREAIQKSMRSGRASASEPVLLADREKGAGLGFVLFEPIYKTSNGLGVIEHSHNEFVGVVAGGYQFSSIVEEMMDGWRKKGFELRLKAPKDGEDLIVYDTNAGVHEDAFIQGMFAKKSFSFAGQEWSFCYFINPDYYNQNINFVIWYGLIAGLIFVYFAGVFLLAITGQAASMERLVEAKTKELSSKNKFLNIVMDSVPDMIFVKDKNFNIVQANQAFFEKYDPATRGDLLGSTGLEQFPEDEQEVYLENDKKALEEGHSEVEETITDYRGVTRTMITRKARFYNDESEPFLLGHARDVTDFLNAQRKLENILDSTADGLITIRENGIVETYNQACERIFGYSAEEVIGQNVSMLMPDETAQNHGAYLNRYIQTGEKKVIGQNREVEARHKDGSLFPVELSVAEVKLGGRRIFSGVLRDITEKKKAEELSQQIAQIFSNANVEFYIFDAESFTFLFVNEGAVKNMGYSKEELIGHRPSEFVPAYKDNKFYGMAEKLVSGEMDRIEFDMQHVRKNGTTYDVLANIQLTQFDGRPAFIASMLDVTERNKIIEDLKRSNKELENFAYVTSHDLKAPLRHVSMSAGFFKEKFGDKLDDKSQELLEAMLSGTERMQNMIESLLAYSRVGRDESQFEQVKLNDILLAVRQNLSEEIFANSAVIESRSLPIIHANRVMMIQLFQNLIQNSIKYRKPDIPPRVVIGFRNEDDYVVISFEDNGIGVDAAYADKVFQIFQRLHRDNEYEGVGIGLSICQRIVEFHGGSIYLDKNYSGVPKLYSLCLKINISVI